MQRDTVSSHIRRWQRGLLFIFSSLLVATASVSFIHSNVAAAGELTITSILPSTGEVTGGDSLTITGTGFTPSVTVLFADTAATSVSYVNETTITAVAPAGVAGIRDVSVVDGAMRSTLPRAYTYIDPTPVIDTISPNAGPAQGGQEVVIAGAHFTDGTKELTGISSGVNFSCGIYGDARQAGAAYCWGLNTNGQLGNGTRNSATVPVAVDTSGVLANKTITSISTGTSHTCAIADGSAYCWGLNTNGQLGNGVSGAASTSYMPVAVDMTGVLAGKTVTAISAGSQHTCAVADGAAYCWGYGYMGRLGTGSTSSANVVTPAAVTATGVLSDKVVTSISVGISHTCAVADGAAYCWGEGSSGRLGTGATSISYVPAAVSTGGVLGGKTVTSISTGSVHTCAVASAAAYCWGGSYLGNGSASSTTPVAVTTTGVLAGKLVSSVSASVSHSCVVADGAAYCWGVGSNGRLGTGSTVSSALTPVAVDATGALTGKALLGISTGTAHTCAIANDNRVYCWGQNTNGQLGDDETADSLGPVGVTRVAIQAPVVLFGDKPATNVRVESSTRIVAVTPAHVPSSSDISIVLYNDRSVTAAGLYEFIIGPSVDSITPTSGVVYGGDLVTVKGAHFQPGMKVKIGGFYADNVTYIDEQTVIFETLAKPVASRVDISIEDKYGQQAVLAQSFTYVDPMPIIDGVSPSSGPAQGGQEVVVTGSNFTVGTKELSDISTGTNHSCGIYSDATHSAAVYCWGLNTDGQLGDGTRNSAATPVAVDTTGVLAGKTVTAVSASSKHTCAVADGAAYCWGDGGNGRLGHGVSSASYSPVAVSMTGVLADKTVTAISAGDQHTCAVADGAAYCWGYGYVGRLGTGSTSSASIATPVAVTAAGTLAGKTVTAISAAYAHTCAVADGAAYCWGDGGGGRLGVGNTSTAYAPVAVDVAGVLHSKIITSISTSNAHTCAVASGAAYCWGGSYLGDGSAGSHLPVAVSTSGVLAGKTVTAISVGVSHTCVMANSAAYCWGVGSNGRLGTGSVISSTLVPVAVSTAGAIGTKAVAAISAGNAHTCVVADDNQGYCWGLNTNSQLGDGTTTDALGAGAVNRVGIQGPTVLFGDTTAASVVVESSTRMVVVTPAHAIGVVDMKMSSYDGQSAVLPASYTYTAPPIISSILPAKGLIAGGDIITITGFNFDSGAQVTVGAIAAPSTIWNDEHTLSVTTPVGSYGMRDITVINGDGQSTTALGAFSYTEPAMAVDAINPVTGPSIGGQTITITGENFSQGNRTIRQVSVSDTHSCGIYDGAAYCWGDGGSGQLGNGLSGAASVSNTPVAVDATGVLADKTVTAISAGDQHTCAVADGAAYCWGYGYNGRLGIGTSSTNMTRPTAVTATGVLAGKTVTDISVGNAHTCAVADDNAYCWGDGGSGRLGVGNTNTAYTPVAVDTAGVLAGKTVTDISVGNAHTCAVASGAAYCWGGSYLGNGTANSPVPVAVDTAGVLAGKTVTSLAAGASHTCVTANSAAYCWGIGSNGRLGTGSTINSALTPVAVEMAGALADKTITSISVGAAHTCAVASDYQVYCWGQNANGQLGNGGTTDSLMPVAVSQGRSVQTVSAGNNSSCLVAFDGQAYCWGRNTNGQLGDGTTNDRTLPVASQPVTTRNLEVLLGGIPATDITITSPTLVTAKTPAHTEGSAALSVRRYDDQTVTKPAAYTYVAQPAVTSSAPSSGILTGGDTVTVTGGNFTDGMRALVGENEATMVDYLDPTTIRFVVPMGSNPATVDVTLIDIYGQTAVLPAAYTYQLPSPTITSISPTSGPMTGGTVVTITGTGFMHKPSGGSWYSAMFGASVTNQVTYVNDTTLEVRTPARSPGRVDVRIQSDHTTPTTLPSAFTYVADHYRFINSPLSIAANQPGRLTIRAENASNNPAASSQDTTIQLSTSSPSGQFAVDLAESEITRWSHTEVVLPAYATSVNVWYRDANSGTPTVTSTVSGSIATQQQTIGSKYKLQVTGIASPVRVGSPSSVTVRAVDFTGQPLAGYSGTVRFSSTDAAAQLPGETTMTSSDGGIKTMTNGVMMGSPGTYCVTVTDSVDSSIAGQQCGITVQPAATGVISQLAIISQSQSIPKNSYSAPITIQTQDSNGQAISVAADTTLYLSTNSSTAEFSHDGRTWSGEPKLTVTVAAGMTAANVYYRDSATRTATISARDQVGDTTDGGSGDFGFRNATQIMKTGVGAPERMHITGPPNLMVGDKGVMSVELRDADGNIVTATSDITIRVGADTETTRFYLADSPEVAQVGPVEFIIPAGSTKGTVTVSDSIAGTSGTFTNLQFVDGREQTEVIRLSDAQWQLQIVSGYPASIKASTETEQVDAGVSVPVTFEFYTDTDSPVTTTTTVTTALSSTLGGEYSLMAEPFTPITQLTFNPGDGKKTVYYRSTIAGSAQLRAVAANLTSTPAALEVGATEVARFGLSAASLQTPIHTVSSALTVTAYDVFGNVTATSADTSIYLHANQPTMRFSGLADGPWSIQPEVIILSGQSTTQFYARDNSFHDDPVAIIASDVSALDSPDTGITNGTLAMRIVSQPVASIAFVSPERTVVAGEASEAVQVELRQADGAPAVQDGTMQLRLSATEGKVLSVQDASAGGAVFHEITKGESSLTVYYSGEQAGVHTLDAQYGSGIGHSQSVTVTAAAIANMAFMSQSQTVPTGTASAPIRLSFTDAFGNPATSEVDRTVQLQSNCGTGTFSESAADWQVMTELVLPAGAVDATVYYRSTVVGTCVMTVSSTGLDDAAQTMTIVADAPTRLAVVASTISPIRGSSTGLAVSLLDQFGNVTIADQPLSTTLLSSSTSGEFNRTALQFSPGESTEIASYTDTSSGMVTIEARDEAERIASATTQLTYSDGEADRIAVTPSYSTARASDRQRITVGIANRYDVAINAPQATVIALTSSQSEGRFTNAAGDRIAQLQLAQGQLTAEVFYSQQQAGSVRITPSSPGLEAGDGIISFLPSSIASMRFSNPPYVGNRSLAAGQEGNIQVTLYDNFGNVTTTDEPMTLYARSSHGSGSFSRAGEASITAGSSTTTFTYTQSAVGDFTITMSDTPNLQDTDGGLASIMQQGAVVHGEPYSLAFTANELPLERGAVSEAVTVELRNQYGQVVPATSGGQTIELRNLTSTTGRYATSKNGTFISTLSLYVTPGQTTAQFYYRNDGAQIEDRTCTITDGKRVCQITRTYQHTIYGVSDFEGGSRGASLPVRMTYGAPTQLAFVTPPRTTDAHSSSPAMMVERQNQYGKAVPVYEDQTIYLRSTSGSGVFSSDKIDWQANGAITLNDSDTQASFYYKDATAGQPTITAADTLPIGFDTNLRNAAQAVTIQPSDGPREVTNFLVTNISDPLNQGTVSSVVVVARDKNGDSVADYNGTVTFSSSDPTAILPESYTFNPLVDKGLKTFVSQVAFTTAGEKTVTVTDDTGITGSQLGITVTDGLSAPVSSIVIAQPESPMVVAKDQPSRNITLELRDHQNKPTNAQAGGYPVALMSSSSTGEFAHSPAGPWSKTLNLSVAQGLSFGTFYYRDSVVGRATLVAEDSSGISTEGQILVVVQTLALRDSQTVRSMNAFGILEDSHYLFAHTADGVINGSVETGFVSRDLHTDALTSSQWRTQWRQGVTLLSSSERSNASTISLVQNTVSTTAGQPDFYAVAEATETSFADFDAVVSRQVTASVSPWKSAVTLTQASPTEISAAVTVQRHGVVASPDTLALQVVPAEARSVEEARSLWAEASPGGLVHRQVSTSGLQLSAPYRVLATTYDTQGYVTSQVLSDSFTYGMVAVSPPVEPTLPESETPASVSPARPDAAVPGVRSSMGDNEVAHAPTAQPPEVTTQPQSTPVTNSPVASQEGVDEGGFVQTAVAAAYTTSLLIVVVLLREAYKEVARVYRIRRILRREYQLAVDKNNFLALSAHYLRTPIAILEAAAHMVPSSVNALQPIVATLQTKSRMLLDAGVEQEVQSIVSPDMEKATRSALRSWFFWLPIIVSTVLTLLVWGLLGGAERGMFTNQAMVYATIIVTALGLILFFGARTVMINREQQTMKAALQLHRAQLMNAKTNFIIAVQGELQHEVGALRQLLQDPSLPPQMADLLATSVKKLDGLVTKLQLVTQINGAIAQPESFSVPSLVASITTRHQDAITAKQVTIAQEYDPAAVAVTQDVRLLRYVISTVLDNAIKFSRVGGEIAIRTTKQGGVVALSIANDGNELMTIDMTKHFFEPFSRASNADDLTADGMGLSLYVDKLIMQHLGGSISANRAHAGQGVQIAIKFTSV